MKHLENQKLWRAVLMGMLAMLGLVAFWPSPIDQPVQRQLAGLLKFLHTHGIPTWLNYQFVEASANVMLFVPLGATVSLAYPKRPVWQIGILGLIVSGCIELGQLLFLHNRFASPQDLVTNTAGAVMGALLAAGALKRLGARSLPASGS